jgi:2'-5' RNA ligase
MLRLFLALPIPDEIADRLVAIQRGVPGAKWRPREALHVTLRFVGEVSETLARDLDELVAEIRVAPFELRVTGAGSFGGDEPHALWLGVDGGEPLSLLAQRCERACRKVGLAPEPRAFRPHVTIAYLRGGTDVARVRSFERNQSLFRAGPWLADRFGLYSSWLGKGPSRYVEEAQYPLEGP